MVLTRVRRRRSTAWTTPPRPWWLLASMISRQVLGGCATHRRSTPTNLDLRVHPIGEVEPQRRAPACCPAEPTLDSCRAGIGTLVLFHFGFSRTGRSVGSQLSHAYPKLGGASRAQLHQKLGMLSDGGGGLVNAQAFSPWSSRDRATKPSTASRSSELAHTAAIIAIACVEPQGDKPSSARGPRRSRGLRRRPSRSRPSNRPHPCTRHQASRSPGAPEGPRSGRPDRIATRAEDVPRWTR
jgi:hypothetical protein